MSVVARLLGVSGFSVAIAIGFGGKLLYAQDKVDPNVGTKSLSHVGFLAAIAGGSQTWRSHRRRNRPQRRQYALGIRTCGS